MRERTVVKVAAVNFLRLSVTTRLEIARKLGLDEGLDAMRGDMASLEVCVRVHDQGCFDEFVKLVDEERARR